MENNYRTETDYLPINKWLQDERPIEKLIKKGSEYLSDCELLVIILRTGVTKYIVWESNYCIKHIIFYYILAYL